MTDAQSAIDFPVDGDSQPNADAGRLDVTLAFKRSGYDAGTFCAMFLMIAQEKNFGRKEAEAFTTGLGMGVGAAMMQLFGNDQAASMLEEIATYIRLTSEASAPDRVN